jgi:peptide/nickel transport system ATP-binding protein
MGQVVEGPRPVTTPALSVRGLSVAFAESNGGVVHAATDVSFDLMPGQVLGIVGESGCGKSVTLRTLIQLQDPGRVLGGEVLLAERDVLTLRRGELEAVRGSEIAMVFQDAGSALSPVLTIGDQMREVLRAKCGMGRAEGTKEAVRLLDRVGIPSAEKRMGDYPYQLSGGMKQRVMIALAVAPRPKILLADEPTTALDVTVQDQVLTLLAELRREREMAMILVSHDLGVIAQECDAIAVMYGGYVVEYGALDAVLDEPRHPYTAALMRSTLPANPTADRAPLEAIPGQPPGSTASPHGCPFAPRCAYADEACEGASMRLDVPIPGHGSACIDPGRMR